MIQRSRLYKGKDSEMLVASAVIAQNAATHQPQLAEYDTLLQPEQIADLVTEINTVTTTWLGKDKARELRAATAALLGIQDEALPALTVVRTLIEAKLKNDKPRLAELLTSLGFNTHYERAKKGDQEALIALLFQYKDNFTDELKAELSDKGIPVLKLNAPLAFRQPALDANVLQEGKKAERKEISDQGVEAFNNIYEKVILICKTGQLAFKADLVKKDKFSYALVLRSMNSYAPAPAGTE